MYSVADDSCFSVARNCKENLNVDSSWKEPRNENVTHRRDKESSFYREVYPREPVIPVIKILQSPTVIQ